VIIAGFLQNVDGLTKYTELLKKEVTPNKETLRFLVYYSDIIKRDLANPLLPEEQKELARKVAVCFQVFCLFLFRCLLMRIW
jgi:hypothetical protein